MVVVRVPVSVATPSLQVGGAYSSPARVAVAVIHVDVSGVLPEAGSVELVEQCEPFGRCSARRGDIGRGTYAVLAVDVVAGGRASHSLVVLRGPVAADDPHDAVAPPQRLQVADAELAEIVMRVAGCGRAVVTAELRPAEMRRGASEHRSAGQRSDRSRGRAQAAAALRVPLIVGVPVGDGVRLPVRAGPHDPID